MTCGIMGKYPSNSDGLHADLLSSCSGDVIKHLSSPIGYAEHGGCRGYTVSEGTHDEERRLVSSLRLKPRAEMLT